MSLYGRTKLTPLVKFEKPNNLNLNHHNTLAYNLFKKHKRLNLKQLKAAFDCTSSKVHVIVCQLKKKNLIERDKMHGHYKLVEESNEFKIWGVDER